MLVYLVQVHERESGREHIWSPLSKAVSDAVKQRTRKWFRWFGRRSIYEKNQGVVQVWFWPRKGVQVFWYGLRVGVYMLKHGIFGTARDEG